MEKMEKEKNHKGLIIAGSIIGSFLLLLFVLFFVLTTHTQIVVGLIQKATYGNKPFNSYEPYYEPINGLKENGQYLISEIKYDDEYPNSYLDITYPDGDLTTDRPTLIYFHGGGFFAGSKNMGDPLAASEATALLDDICAQGYNIVNVDYALVPAAHFPVPLIQANRAFAYLLAHQDEYHLDMDNIVIMGSSAGAIISSQMGSIVTNPEYASLLGITPALTPEQIKAVVLDDAPLDYNHFDLATKMLVGNYVKGSIYLNKEEIKKYNNIDSLTANYPTAFLLGSEYRTDMITMSNKLKELGSEHVLVEETNQPHCFVSEERTNPVAKAAFDKLIAFMNEKTK